MSRRIFVDAVVDLTVVDPHRPTGALRRRPARSAARVLTAASLGTCLEAPGASPVLCAFTRADPAVRRQRSTPGHRPGGIDAKLVIFTYRPRRPLNKDLKFNFRCRGRTTAIQPAGRHPQVAAEVLQDALRAAARKTSSAVAEQGGLGGRQNTAYLQNRNHGSHLRRRNSRPAGSAEESADRVEERATAPALTGPALNTVPRQLGRRSGVLVQTAGWPAPGRESHPAPARPARRTPCRATELPRSGGPSARPAYSSTGQEDPPAVHPPTLPETTTGVPPPYFYDRLGSRHHRTGWGRTPLCAALKTAMCMAGATSWHPVRRSWRWPAADQRRRPHLGPPAA